MSRPKRNAADVARPRRRGRRAAQSLRDERTERAIFTGTRPVRSSLAPFRRRGGLRNAHIRVALSLFSAGIRARVFLFN